MAKNKVSHLKKINGRASKLYQSGKCSTYKAAQKEAKRQLKKEKQI